MFDAVEQVEIGDALVSQFDLESRAGAKEMLDDAAEQIGSWLRTLGEVAVVRRAAKVGDWIAGLGSAQSPRVTSLVGEGRSAG